MNGVAVARAAQAAHQAVDPINTVDNRAEIVRAHAIVPRDQTAKAAQELHKLVAEAKE